MIRVVYPFCLESLLAAALALLDEGGGQGLTMRALAARLGVFQPEAVLHSLSNVLWLTDRAGQLR